MLRFLLVVWLVALLPLAFLATAAAGPTLSDPAGGARVAVILIAHVAGTIGTFALLIVKGRSEWPWLVALALGLWFPALILTRELISYA